MTRRLRAVSAILFLGAYPICGPLHAEGPADWPQFRGPAGAGIAKRATLPLTWSSHENVVWMADIPGRGWSSPIVWGNRVFVTSAVSAGAFKQPSTGIYGNDGDTFVFEAGDAYKQLAKNSLGEMSFATPAADADGLYVRTQTKLYRISETK